jgi:hypothetical protein
MVPAFWIAFVVLLGVVLMPAHMWERDPLYLVGPLLAVVVLAVGYRRMTSDLVDEVRDGGHFLMVRKGDVEDRIALADILHINADSMSYPDRLTLRLQTPGRFGDQIDFLVGKSRWPLDPRPSKAIVESLIQRVDEARHGANR